VESFGGLERWRLRGDGVVGPGLDAGKDRAWLWSLKGERGGVHV
jgi:hypothetical protein